MDKSLTLNVPLKWPHIPDDYLVRYQKHEIGRIRHSGQSDPERTQGEWMAVIRMALPSWSRGRTANRNSGLKAFAAAWQKLLKETGPERMWELERHVAARQNGSARPHGNSAQPHGNSASPAAQLAAVCPPAGAGALKTTNAPRGFAHRRNSCRRTLLGAGNAWCDRGTGACRTRTRRVLSLAQDGVML